MTQSDKDIRFFYLLLLFEYTLRARYDEVIKSAGILYHGKQCFTNRYE